MGSAGQNASVFKTTNHWGSLNLPWKVFGSMGHWVMAKSTDDIAETNQEPHTITKHLQKLHLAEWHMTTPNWIVFVISYIVWHRLIPPSSTEGITWVHGRFCGFNCPFDRWTPNGRLLLWCYKEMNTGTTQWSHELYQIGLRRYICSWCRL
jgi:hypothetical protein